MQCSSFTLESKQQHMYWGRTLDNTIDPRCVIRTIPAGKEMKTHTGTWTCKHSFTGVALTHSYFYFDGINDTGLMGGLFFLEEGTWAKSEDINIDETPIVGEEFVAWILSQFGTIDEIEEAVSNAALVDKHFWHLVKAPLHYTFVDKDHRAIVLEPVNNGRFNIYKDTMGVMTNSPEYPWHVDNLRNFIELQDTNRFETKIIHGEEVKQIESGSGLLGLNGDYTAPTRFIKAAYLSEFADTPDDKDAIMTMYNIFKSVMITKGWEKQSNDGTSSDYTIYWSGYDQENLTVYMQPSGTNTMTKVTLNNPEKVSQILPTRKNSYYEGREVFDDELENADVEV